jgi:hypothetical protein
VPFTDQVARKHSIEVRGIRNGATDATAAELTAGHTAANLGDRQAKGLRRLVDAGGVLTDWRLEPRCQALVEFGINTPRDRFGEIVEQCGQDVVHGHAFRARRRSRDGCAG